MGTPTINIGDRQKGRDRAASVVDVPATAAVIREAVTQAFATPHGDIRNPYDQGATSQKILAILKQTDFPALKEKTYYDA